MTNTATASATRTETPTPGAAPTRRQGQIWWVR
jgi:hypothetical protein